MKVEDLSTGANMALSAFVSVLIFGVACIVERFTGWSAWHLVSALTLYSVMLRRERRKS